MHTVGKARGTLPRLAVASAAAPAASPLPLLRSRHWTHLPALTLQLSSLAVLGSIFDAQMGLQAKSAARLQVMPLAQAPLRYGAL